MEVEYKYNFIFNPKSNRLENFEYSGKWTYFITICCKDRQNYFWEILDSEMISNEYGRIVENEIKNIPIFRDNVVLDYYVVMPNHIHIILFLKNNDFTNNEMFLPNISTKMRNEENYFSKISPIKNELWNIIKLFKWFVSKNINILWKEPYFAWQRNYYDRIIRNDEELFKIRKYIENNPKKWQSEKDNEQGIFM